jgi:uncharacterized repeat protein (TIGR02543 family)
MNKICILMIPVLIISMGLFFACGDSEETVVKATTCTVTFDPNGGTVNGASTLTVVVGRDTPLGGQYPTPVKAGFAFCGWWDGSMRYRANDPINTSLTLKAKWLTADAAEYWNVTFVTDGGTGVTSPIKIVKGEPLGLLYPITWKEGFYFDGWYNGGTEYAVTTPPISGDLTLTAKWTVKTLWSVTFDSGTGNRFEGSLSSAIGTYGEGGHPASPGIPADPGSPNRTFTIKVWDGDGIFNRLPTTTGTMEGDVLVKKDSTKDVLYNRLSPLDDPLYYFWVQWIDNDNRLYVEDAFIPITEDITLKPKWGAPDYIVPLRTDPADPIKTPVPTLVSHVDTDLPSGCDPIFRVTQDEEGNDVYTIWNATESNSAGRWQILYRIQLNLPDTFSIRYYNKYSVNAKFYGNVKATAAYRTVEFPTDTLMPSQFYIQNAGDQMIPNRHGYGQMSFTINLTGNGGGADDATILQQYNLGMGQDGDGGSINSTWKPSKAGDEIRDPEKPAVLLIQTSDDWIGRIEVTEIRFHNDADFVPDQE